MLSRGQAKQLAQTFLDSQSGDAGCQVAILDSATLERAFGWVFFYQSREYLESGNPSHLLAGNAPLIVSRATGDLVVTGTAEPIENYIARLEETAAGAA
jgi:hypothetical protein